MIPTLLRRPRHRGLPAAASALLAWALLAWARPAGAQAPAAPGGAAPRAEVIHWWTSGGESAAVKTLADAYRAQGGVWVDMAVASFQLRPGEPLST